MEITINDIKQRIDYATPNNPVRLLDIWYQTDAGYKGMYTMKKNDFNKDTIGDVLKADAEHISQSIGTTLKV